MRSLFPEYYGHDERSYETLWQNATFVLDTNVLLNAYRLPDEAREEFLSLLDSLKDRLWIPHQVGLEFQRRRIDVISQRRKKLDDLKSGIQLELSETVSKIKDIEIEKHRVETDIDKILAGLDGCKAEVSEALSDILDKYSAISHVDKVRDRIDEIFEGRVGQPPADQEALDQIFKEGEKRFSHRIPPGYEDATKSKDPKSQFGHRGLIYEAQYGDLVLWMQLLDWAKSSKLETVIFVTADNKEDWWHRVSGKTIGPRPELVSEIAEQSGVTNFWMYSFSQFGQNAKTYIDAELSEDSLKEISRVSLDLRKRRKLVSTKRSKAFELRAPDGARRSNRRMDVALGWAGRNSWNSKGAHFADRVFFEKERVVAVEIKEFENIYGSSHFSKVMDSLIQADFHLDEEHIDCYQLVYIIDKLRDIPINYVNDMLDIMRRFKETSYRGGEIEIILGDIVDDVFEPLAKVVNLNRLEVFD